MFSKSVGTLYEINELPYKQNRKHLLGEMSSETGSLRGNGIQAMVTLLG